MGQSGSSPLLAPLKTLLKQRGISVRKSSLLRFLDDVAAFAPWFAHSGSLSLPSWLKLGNDIERARRTGLCMDPILVPIWETVRACPEAESTSGLSPSPALLQARRALQETQSASSADGSCKGKPPESNASSDSSDSESDGDETNGADAPPLIDWEGPPISPTRPSAPPASAAAPPGMQQFPVNGFGDLAKNPHHGLPLVAESGARTSTSVGSGKTGENRDIARGGHGAVA
ncbi:uncharacterized protein LOC143648524 [Tamandua tetradactyla]|uniref:uncharacterized protein LOC143648524 n=1 Tax=Tamandua tetradactyla TaxID=48850 RepID=UPI00405404C9